MRYNNGRTLRNFEDLEDREMAQVSFDKKVFKKVLDDYANWKEALVRELLQNAIDAGATEIEIETYPGEIRCTDNGHGISREILKEALLHVGGSWKANPDSEGGFGRAKELLFFAHPRWLIRSQDYFVEGSYIEYEIFDGNECPLFNGTEVVIQFEEDDVPFGEDLGHLAKRFIRECSLSCKVFVNGEKVVSNYRGWKRVGSLSFGEVRAKRNKSNWGQLSVLGRSGLKMFSYSVSVPADVVVQLNVPSVEVCTTNRDGLKYAFQEEVMNLLARVYERGGDVVQEDEAKVVFVNFDGVLASGFAVGGDSNPKSSDLVDVEIGKAAEKIQREGNVEFPFVVHVYKHVRCSKKVVRCLKLWETMKEFVVSALKEEGLLPREASVLSGITDDGEAAAVHLRVYGSHVVAFNPDYFLRFSRSAVGLAMHDKLLHELAHIWTGSESRELQSQECKIEKALYSSWKRASRYGKLLIRRTWEF